MHAHFLSTINSQPSTPRAFTSPYRHGVLLYVHQVELAPPRLSWIPEAPRPGVRSSGPPFPVQLRRSARSYQAVSVICLRRLLSLHRQISWIPLESGKVSHFLLHPLQAMVRAFHFVLRLGSVILHLAVRLAMVKAVGLVACRSLEREKGSRQAVVLASFAAGSSPELDRFFPVADLSGPCLVIADFGTAADLSAAAGLPDLVVAAGSAVAAAGSVVAVVGSVVADLAFDPACSVCLV